MSRLQKNWLGLALVGGLGWMIVCNGSVCMLSVDQAREMTLKQDLFEIRHALQVYFEDTGRHPRSLEELVQARYLKSIPVDPFTRRADWVLECSADGAGIVEVRSAVPSLAD